MERNLKSSSISPNVVSSTSVKGRIKPYNGDLSRAWEWDGHQLKPYHGDLSRAWEWNGRQLKPYHADLSRTWEIEGDIPIPVIAKAAGII